MRTLGWMVVLAVGCKSADKPPEATPATGSAKFKHVAGDRRNPVIADAPPLELAVSVKGVASVWKQDSFDKVPRYTKGPDGEGRDVWSLRELAHVLVGPTARVVAVAGEGGTKPVEPAGWDDATRTPVVHTTRRGTLKFTWTDAEGKWGETVVKDVTRLEIEP